MVLPLACLNGVQQEYSNNGKLHESHMPIKKEYWILTFKENTRKDEKIKTERSDYEIRHSRNEGKKELNSTH
jgi:hypothetical protein